MKKLIRLVEVEKGAVELKKGTSDSDIKKYTDKGIDVQLVDPSTEKLEEEVGRKYTAEESAAVGKTVGRSLLKVLRAQGDEVVDIRLTGVGLNKFGIKVKYGNDKGKDTFRFMLNPDTEDITLALGRGDQQQLVDFIITQGNTVSLPTPELESKLADAMKKYTSEPSDAEYDQMAAMEPETDPSQMNKYIGEKKLTKPELKKREEIVKSMKKQGEPKDARTYAIATAQAKKLAEKLDPVGKEDSDINNDGKVNTSDKYLANRRQSISKNIGEDLDLGHKDNEPGMLLSDIYGIMQSAKSLYELVSQFEGHQEVDFPHWWQAKIVNAKANLSAARQYLDYEVNKPQQVNIAAVALQERKKK